MLRFNSLSFGTLSQPFALTSHCYIISISNIMASCRILNTSVDALIKEFDSSLKTSADNYSRKLVEFCSIKALERICCEVGEKISDGNFSRFTFDMMLAWQIPNNTDEESCSAYVNSFLFNNTALSFVLNNFIKFSLISA